jgi:hypothetical protein
MCRIQTETKEATMSQILKNIYQMLKELVDIRMLKKMYKPARIC